MNNQKTKSTFIVPVLIMSAAVVGIIAILGIVLALTGEESKSNSQVAPTSSPTTPATSTDQKDEPLPRTDSGEASICGLTANVDGPPIGLAPEADWSYIGAYAYPRSGEFGPAATHDAGYEYCFQQSQEGALFFAAYAAAYAASAPKTWFEYVISEGPYRAEFLDQVREGTAEGRMDIRGFRVLEYTQDTALIDIAISISNGGVNGTISGIYSLKWENGDWKFSADEKEFLDVEVLPSLHGYTAWGNTDGS